MRAVRAAAAGLLVASLTSGAAAHSLLLESSPAAGATLTASPEQVTLRFNNRIEKKLSTIRLVDERGAARAVAVPGAGGPADRLTAPLSPLSPGAWRLEWRVLSTDGHIVSGAFSFRVAP